LKVTYNWLKEFVDELDRYSPYEIAEKLTMSGTEVKKVEYVGEHFKNIIVGKILSFSKHPNADKLSLCSVDTGKNILNIVCGAKNFKVNDVVAVALEGARIQDFVIKKSKIRGIFSEGMMCSEKELGISEESSGIMILDDSFEIGKDFASQAGLDDWVFELEITPNRPDCLSVAGIAREVSALVGLKFRCKDYGSEFNIHKSEQLKIEIKDYELCPRYSAKIFEIDSYPSSPLWIKNRLMQCEVRAINLIVDLTNYVMLETGQPLHAFDLDKLTSKKIIVRRAKKAEKLFLIDGTEKVFEESDIVIADESGPIALAGIMGGKNTEISEATQHVLLESANFNGAYIMKTSKRIGLRSEASNRFEKKLDPQNTINAIGRFDDLFCSITNTESDKIFYDNYSHPTRTRKIDLRVYKLNDFLGTKLDIKNISSILSSLGLDNKSSKDMIEVEIPSFRFEDLEREVDLFEEIARIYGYEKIPIRTPIVLSKQGKYTNEQKISRKIKDILIGMGLKEVINYSFVSRKDLSVFSLDDEEDYKNYVKIMNPLNEDFEIMRTTLLQSLVKNAKDNIYKKINDIGIFEISKVFNSVVGNQNEKPLEKNVLAILLTGRRLLKSWNEQERFFDYYDLKGFLESLSELFYHKYELSIESREYKFFHPVISGNIILKNKKMGIIGKIHPKIINDLDIKQDIYFMEIDLDLFMDNMIMEKSYKQFSIFPSVNIDMAFIVD